MLIVIQIHSAYYRLDTVLTIPLLASMDYHAKYVAS